MKLISLDIQFDQVDALTRFKVIVERDHVDWHHPAVRNYQWVGAMIDVERIGRKRFDRPLRSPTAACENERSTSSALPHVPPEIFGRRFKGMHRAGLSDTAGKKSREKPDVRAGIHGDSARKQDVSDELSLRVISISFVSGIKRPVNWESWRKACSQSCEELKLPTSAAW